MSAAQTPAERARERGVTELLHFTSHPGLIGILASGKVQSRDNLRADEYLEEIMLLNSPSRARDAAWTGYVKLSVSRVNSRFMGSSRGWHAHEGVWWACLSFDVGILDHEGVWFSTTNNAYEVTERATGIEGFEAMFGPKVAWGTYGSVCRRTPSTPDHFTTDPQAEVLYPGAVDLSHLRAIYVPEEERTDDVAAYLAGLYAPDSLQAVPCLYRPDVFG